MPKPRTNSGEKNLISNNLIKLRRIHHLSQRDLANKLQLAGYDIDKNVITRIETNKRYVTDIELKAFSQVFQVSYSRLIDGTDKENGQENN
ncbi:helix-turn-helix domain-containing protein [Lachnoclostridium sp. An181]|uniref:helix-turn-helix domain-containing protein n=1 Tax=Lachnoclostridium sp. An181 TaxID=1965575 RepID=UPI000B373C80|nr:helix-turn-helix transcriptional regulator [Lachnoclostridium sp. An181]OUP48982.1 transcriptional regulator [Lachnoclostridium sp. An181]